MSSQPDPASPDPASPDPASPVRQPSPEGPSAPEPGVGPASFADRLRRLPRLPTLVEEAEAVWRARAIASDGSAVGEASAAGEAVPVRPGWRAFEDSFPTFYEFTNRPATGGVAARPSCAGHRSLARHTMTAHVAHSRETTKDR